MRVIICGHFVYVVGAEFHAVDRQLDMTMLMDVFQKFYGCANEELQVLAVESARKCIYSVTPSERRIFFYFLL
jgi:hypothetical protein